MCRTIRREILDICYRTRSGHIGASFSIVEILVVLYFHTIRGLQGKGDTRDKDRVVLSKGHGCPALYATLYHRGMISNQILSGFATDRGTLEQHPSRNPEWGIEVSSGSLGHGLSVAAGIALGDKRDGLRNRVFVILSDGELNEGSTWEAAMFAPHHGLDNLVCIVDYNKMQALGKTHEIIDLEPLAEKWKSFGWAVMDVDGHNTDELIKTFGQVPFNSEKPSCLIAHTVKGKGVCFMENELLWHYRCPDSEEYEKAICELCSP